MKDKSLINQTNFFIISLFLFALLINQYYGNRGIFPVDSFAHFDSGFRILLGEYPFKDYWAVSGPFIDYSQAFFFYLFGVNWQSYLLHASLINALLTLITFFVFKNFNLNNYYSFFYSLLFSVLAYPTSGTPFVDHHSAFLSLIGIYCLIFAIKTEKKIFWVLLPIFFTLAFLSKQVPSSYIIFSVIIVLVIFAFKEKKFYWIKYSTFSFISLIIILLIFGNLQGISLSSFIDQYILYPQSIGKQRIDTLSFTFNGVVAHFKFIYLAFFILFFLNIKKIFSDKKYLHHKDFYYFLILTFFLFSLVLHQILTKNQTFIFFLVPLLFGFSHIYLNKSVSNLNKWLLAILMFICLFATFKYHIRFNENRKFHELNYVNFEFSSNASKIDKKLSGLKWITPQYKNRSNEEMDLINKVKIHLLNDNRTKMVITNYSFFSAILNEKTFAPSRWYLADGTAYPLKNNKFFNKYKNLLLNLIKNNKIDVIYTIYPENSSIIFKYLDKSCFKETKISEMLNSYELINCYTIN
jgi:hypothetical protein